MSSHSVIYVDVKISAVFVALKHICPAVVNHVTKQPIKIIGVVPRGIKTWKPCLLAPSQGLHRFRESLFKQVLLVLTSYQNI
jgi:hypothetical protein